MPTDIPTDTYFESREFKLNDDDWGELYGFIQDSIFYKIVLSLDNESLIALRIEGHTDKRKPESREGRKWDDNMELSFYRAKEVANILDSIMVAKIKAEELTLLQRDELKKRIRIAGFGENKPQFDVKLIKGDYYVFNVDSIVDDPEGPYNLSAAKHIAYQRNRRVVINIIERGI